MSGSIDIGGLEAGPALLGFVADMESIETLRSGLHGVGSLDLRKGAIRQAIRHLEKEPAPRAILVDISDSDNAQAVLDDLARVCPPDVQVFVVGDNHDIAFYRMLVDDLGVTEYLPKPLTRDSVQRQILARMAPGASEVSGGRGGQVVAVCGARGGVGASTIAAGLAMELAEVAKGHVVLFDLHLKGGSLPLMLSANPGVGLRLALEDAERADSLFLERTAITIAPRLHLIAADEPLDSELRVSAEAVSRLIGLMQRKFNFVVIDLPMPMPPEMAAAIEAARHVVVALTPDVVSLRDAKAIRGWISSLKGANRTITVLNHADAKGGLSAKLMEKGLGAKPDIVIPELGRKMMEAVNLGVPAAQHVPALRRSLAPLVREIAGSGAKGAAGSLLGRILGR